MIAIIISVIFIILLYIANITVNNENLRSLVGTLLIVFSALLGTSISEYLTIPPIEVYRGNTELEITYKNNIPIDTVVVRKTNN
jgi:hypothetical protein